MFIVNVKATGMVAIYRYANSGILRYFKKETVQKEIESIQFENKEIQKELEFFIQQLPMIKAIGLGKREEALVDIYIDFSRFGSKRPEYTIMKNYPLYNKLKHFIVEK